MKQKLRLMALALVFLLGIVVIAIPRFLSSNSTDKPESTEPQVQTETQQPAEAVFLSIGCSMIATAISTLVLTLGEDKSTADMLRALKEAGIDIELHKRHNRALVFPSDMKGNKIKGATKKALEKYKINRSYAVGRNRTTTIPYYYDLIGGTCDHKAAEFFARLLSSFWANNSADQDVIRNAGFDFIVTPKGGSPMLGYEFAQLANKPFVLHEELSRFHNNDDDMRTWFDCSEVPEKGKTALIVDDSATGGTMVKKTIADLKRYGYNVYTCLVVFEPVVKDAREQLNQCQVQLVSLIKTHQQ